MEELKKNKAFWILVIVVAFNLVVFVGGPFVIDKVANCVIKKLKAEYSPSPYGPGVDPDKINVDAFKTSRKNELKSSDPEPVKTKNNWRENFEKERGVTE